MQEFYRALRFYPTCHISCTDLSHDDGGRRIELRREKTRMAFFSIDKTGVSKDRPLNALFLFLPRRGANSITSRSIPVIYPFGERRFRSVSLRLPGN